MNIRDTSQQDRPLALHSAQSRKRRQWLFGGMAGLVLLFVVGWLVAGWNGGSRSFDADRVRIAQVTRGDLVRDISAEGRIIAANSPTLYAIAGGTVTLEVVAGDAVKQGEALAVIDSPELRSKLAQEQAVLASLEAEAGRAVLDAQIARSAARQSLDQAGIDRQAAQRDLQRVVRSRSTPRRRRAVRTTAGRRRLPGSAWPVTGQVHWTIHRRRPPHRAGRTV